jgi:hypothetical protein
MDDMSESKKHLDFFKDFPFKGHGTPTEDLEAIKKSVSDKTMPPSTYLIMHRQAELSPEEIKTISDWVDESLKELAP